MSDLLQIVSRLEESGGTLLLNGDRILYSVPKGNPEAQSLLAELRKHRERVMELLQQRDANQHEWPPESFEAERRFGQAHAKLFPFLGRKVRTPAGSGTLIQVFADRVTVVLDTELSRCTFLRPTEIEPVSWELP